MVLRCLDRWATVDRGSVHLARSLAALPWVREPDRWTGDGSIVDHLLKTVKYPLPGFLYRLLPGDRASTPDVRLALATLAFVASGRPLRDAPGLPGLTAREAHVLWTTREAESVAAAVRMAQVTVAGGPAWLAAALARTCLGQLGADELRWGPVVRWMAKHADGLPPDRIGPIVDYLRWSGVLPTSVTRLVREEERWHASIVRRVPGGPQGPLPSSGFPGVKLEHDGAVWSFAEIRSGEDLREEGSAMRHCVATYHGVIVAGRSSIWSMRKDGVRSLTIEVWNQHRAVVQVRGWQNRRATAEEQAVIDRWAESLSLVVRDRVPGTGPGSPA
jgi:hypothetical protein